MTVGALPVLFVDGVKPCSVCGEYKTPEEFNRATRAKSGYASRCKACQRLYKLKRGDTIHEMRVKRVAVKLRETQERRARKDAPLQARLAERAANGHKPRGALPAKIVDGRKACSACREVLPVAEFYHDSHAATGYDSRCKACRKARRKPYDEHRRYNLMYKYGITPEEYDRRLVAQGGGCAICGRKPEDERLGVLHVDHCHNSLKVRGLLCEACNTALGKFNDDADRLLAAAAYLLVHEEQ